MTIIICSFFLDRVGYKPLLLVAFLLHVASAVVTLAATPIFDSMGGPLAARMPRTAPIGACISACSCSPWPTAYAKP